MVVRGAVGGRGQTMRDPLIPSVVAHLGSDHLRGCVPKAMRGGCVAPFGREAGGGGGSRRGVGVDDG